MSGIRIFEQTLVDDPNYQGSTQYDNHRFAFGKAGSPERNITLLKFKTWLSNVLGSAFLYKSSNLIGLDLEEVHDNLSLYPKDETYTQAESNLIFNNVQNNTFGGLRVAWVGTIKSGVIAQTGGYQSDDFLSKFSLGAYTIGDNTNGNDRQYKVAVLPYSDAIEAGGDFIKVTHSIVTLNRYLISFFNNGSLYDPIDCTIIIYD